MDRPGIRDDDYVCPVCGIPLERGSLCRAPAHATSPRHAVPSSVLGKSNAPSEVGTRVRDIVLHAPWRNVGALGFSLGQTLDGRVAHLFRYGPASRDDRTVIEVMLRMTGLPHDTFRRWTSDDVFYVVDPAALGPSAPWRRVADTLPPYGSRERGPAVAQTIRGLLAALGQQPGQLGTQLALLPPFAVVGTADGADRRVIGLPVLEHFGREPLLLRGLALAAYGAPELLFGRVDPEAAARYALGLLITTLLTGRAPHGGRNVRCMLRAKLTAGEPIEAAFGDAIPELAGPIRDGIATLLEQDPARRGEPDTLPALLRALAAGTATLAVGSARIEPPPPTPSTPRNWLDRALSDPAASTRL